MTSVAEHEQHPVQHGPPRPPRGLRRLLYPGFLRAAWMAPLFFGIGCGIVVLSRWWGGWHPIWFGEIIVLVGALTAAPVGFLAGIGAFDYWVRYAIGSPTKPEDHSGHGAYSWKDYFRVNTDHKVIGMQYLATTIFFFLAGGLLAMLVRAELDDPPAFRHAVRSGSGQSQLQRRSGRPLCRQGSGERRRRVDHEDVARREKAGQIGEPAVRDVAAPLPGDEEPDAVAGEAACLGGLVRLEPSWNLELQGAAHTFTAASSRAL